MDEAEIDDDNDNDGDDDDDDAVAVDDIAAPFANVVSFSSSQRFSSLAVRSNKLIVLRMSETG